MTLLAIVGLGRLFASGHPYRFLFLAVLVAPSLPYVITHVSYRYRYPINGFVCLLCCECLARSMRDRCSVAPRGCGGGLGPGGDDGVLDGRVIVDQHAEPNLLQEDRDPGIGLVIRKAPPVRSRRR